MKDYTDVMNKLRENTGKRFPRGCADWKEGYLHALRWVLDIEVEE